jgi:putative tricarboxylic transport membrane protein
MKKTNVITSIVLLFVSVVLFLHVNMYPAKSGLSPVQTPGFYPKLLAIILGVLSLIYLVQSLVIVDESEGVKKIKLDKGFYTFLATVGMLILYPFALNLLGFLLSSFIFIFVEIILLTQNAKRKMPLIIGISVLLVAIMQITFNIILRIPFPKGIIF